MLYDRYIEGKSIPHAVKEAVGYVASILEVNFIRTDTGERTYWQEDDEPQPAIIDSWASGVVPVRKRFVVREDNPPTPASLEASVHSGTSHNTSVSRKSNTKRRTRTVEPPSKVFLTIPLETIVDDEPDFDEANRQRIEDKAVLAKKEAERKKKQQREALEVARKIEREQTELAKKALTYDYEGKLIFTKPAVLSNATYLPKFTVQVVEAQVRPKRVASTEIADLREKRAPSKEVDFVRTIKAHNVMWDSIQTSKGVIMRLGSKAKGEYIDRGGRMTRKEYMRKAKALLPSISEMKDSSVSKEQTTDSKDAAPVAVGDVPDYELPYETEMLGMSTSSPLANQPKIIQYRSTDPHGAEELSDIDRFNLSILEDRDWGVSPPLREVKLPARTPKRPDFKTLQSTHGYKMRLPRERPLNEHVGKRLNISYDTESTMVTEFEPSFTSS